MSRTATKVEVKIFVNGEPKEVTTELLTGLVKEAFKNAKVPVQDAWVTYQCQRITKKWTAFQEIIASLL